jgi:hypothetical protein
MLLTQARHRFREQMAVAKPGQGALQSVFCSLRFMGISSGFPVVIIDSW